jgi:hypothetical protein
MNAVLIEALTKSDVRFLLDLSKQIGAEARVVNTEDIEDKILAKLIEEGLKTPNVSFEAVMKVFGE